MKKHKLAKNALENPELFSPAELAYFDRWLRARKERKQKEKEAKDTGFTPSDSDLN
jgi:hypothetical protein